MTIEDLAARVESCGQFMNTAGAMIHKLVESNKAIRERLAVLEGHLGAVEYFREQAEQIEAAHQQLQQEQAALAQRIAQAGTSGEKSRKRKKPNKADYDAVMAFPASDKATEVEQRVGIPASTVRRYRKMTPEDVAALPPGEPATTAAGTETGTQVTAPSGATVTIGDTTGAQEGTANVGPAGSTGLYMPAFNMPYGNGEDREDDEDYDQ